VKPFTKLLVIDIGVLVGCFFLIWNLTAGSDFLIPSVHNDYVKSLPLALMYTALVGILIILGTVLLFLPRRRKQ
jgi:hypothetical protein